MNNATKNSAKTGQNNIAVYMTAVFHQVPSALSVCRIENDLDKVFFYNASLDVPIRGKSDKKWGKFRARVTVGRCGSRKKVNRRWRLYATDTRVLESGTVDRSNANSQLPTVPSIEIPVTCYQVPLLVALCIAK